MTPQDLRKRYTPEQIGKQLDYLDNQEAMWRGRKCYKLAAKCKTERAIWLEALPEDTED